MNWMRGKPEAVVMDVTPAIASELLATSTGNRRIRQWYVSMLSGAMKRGEWRVISQGIGIDKNGILKDAHHRMNAVIESGVTVPMLVVMGLDDDAVKVTDQGMKRTLSDILNIRKEVAEIGRAAAAYLYGGHPTPDQNLAVFNCGIGVVGETLINYCNTKSQFFSSSSMKLAASVLMLDGHDSDYILAQYRALAIIDVDAMSPASRALLRQRTSGKLVSTNHREALARGLKVFDKGRTDMSKIQISDADMDSSAEYVRSVLREAMTK
jgi:hypothetical protein